jgi:hypothetical protein
MSKVIITADQHNLGPEPYSFFIFDLETNKVVDKASHTTMLDADIPQNAGRKPFRPFGIAQSEDYIFIASNTNIVRFDNKTLEAIDIVCDTGVINTHHIAYSQGYLYRTNTSNDTISRIDLDSLEEIHFSFNNMSRVDQINKPINYDVDDHHHINSLLIHEDQIYVMAHNNNDTDSEVFRLSLDFKEVHSVARLERCHHDIIIQDGLLYSLATLSGKLIILNLDNGHQDKYTLTDKTGYVPSVFLRGMDLVDGKLEIIASLAFISNNKNVSGNATRITFDINDHSITKRPIDELAIITCVQLLKSNGI